MEQLVQMDWFTLVLVGCATMFLIGEILVNMRGLFALFGIVAISLYFYFYLTDFMTVAVMFSIYFIGLLFILIDGKFLGDGTLGIIGIIAMVVSVALTAPNFTAGLYAIIGLVFGAMLSLSFLKFLPRRQVWSKLMLKDRLTNEEGYTTINEEYLTLVGKKGVCVTDLRPVGTVRIDEKDYSCVSEGQWIHKGTIVEVADVDGTKILVKKAVDKWHKRK